MLEIITQWNKLLYTLDEVIIDDVLGCVCENVLRVARMRLKYKHHYPVCQR